MTRSSPSGSCPALALWYSSPPAAGRRGVDPAADAGRCLGRRRRTGSADSRDGPDRRTAGRPRRHRVRRRPAGRGRRRREAVAAAAAAARGGGNPGAPGDVAVFEEERRTDLVRTRRDGSAPAGLHPRRRRCILAVRRPRRGRRRRLRRIREGGHPVRPAGAGRPFPEGATVGNQCRSAPVGEGIPGTRRQVGRAVQPRRREQRRGRCTVGAPPVVSPAGLSGIIRRAPTPATPAEPPQVTVPGRPERAAP